LVVIHLLTRDAIVANNRLRRERQLNSIVTVSVSTGFGTGRATFIVENTKVDGVSVGLGTVRTNVVRSSPVVVVVLAVVVVTIVVVIVVVIVLVLHFCSNKAGKEENVVRELERQRHV